MQQHTHEWMDRLIERLGEQGYRPISAGPGHDDGSRVARRADFRPSWGFTRLHTFVVVRDVDLATAGDVDELIEQATAYAVKNKGGLPRGFQTGVAVLPVLVCRTADDGAVAAAVREPRKQFAAFELPVLVELGEGRVATHHEPHFRGSMYQDFLGEQQRLVAGELHGEVLPPGGEQRARRVMVVGGLVGGAIALVVLLLLVPMMVL